MCRSGASRTARTGDRAAHRRNSRPARGRAWPSRVGDGGSIGLKVATSVADWRTAPDHRRPARGRPRNPARWSRCWSNSPGRPGSRWFSPRALQADTALHDPVPHLGAGYGVRVYERAIDDGEVGGLRGHRRPAPSRRNDRVDRRRSRQPLPRARVAAGNTSWTAPEIPSAAPQSVIGQIVTLAPRAVPADGTGAAVPPTPRR